MAPVAPGVLEEFWSWWDGARHVLDARIDDGLPADHPTLIELADRIAAFGDGLEFEVGPGLVAGRMLCITAAGQPARRAAVARLMRAAPSGDDHWEYHQARPAKPFTDITLAIGNETLRVTEARVRINEHKDERLVDVTVDHAAFAAMSEDERGRAALMMLDIALGELDVESYVGAVETRSLRWRSQPIAALPKAIADLHARRETDRASGIVRWHSWQALVDGDRKVRTIDRDVHHCEHPLLDARFYLGIGLLNPTEFGLVSDDEADALYALEDEIKDELGHDAVLVARDSNSGFRTLHFYYDTESDALDTVKERARALKNGGRAMTLTRHDDPAWAFAASIGLR